MSELLNSKLKHSSPYHPQTNGLVTRTNQNIIVKISEFVSKYRLNWDKALPFVHLKYRLSPIGKLQMSSFEMLYGRKVIMPRIVDSPTSDFELMFEDLEEFLNKRVETFNKVQSYVKEVNKENCNKQKMKDESRESPDSIQEGTIVYIKNRKPLYKLD